MKLKDLLEDSGIGGVGNRTARLEKPEGFETFAQQVDPKKKKKRKKILSPLSLPII